MHVPLTVVSAAGRGCGLSRKRLAYRADVIFGA